MTIQAKPRRIFEGITVKLSDPESNFEAISGGFIGLELVKIFVMGI
jgi:hypothetical protein